MTELFQISPDTSAEGVRRLLARIRNRQIVLELPEGWHEIDNMARMRLLQRQAQVRGQDVALVTRHEATRKAAQQVGVPVFYDAEQALNSTWQMNPLLPLIHSKQAQEMLPERPWGRRGTIQRLTHPQSRQQRQLSIEAQAQVQQSTLTWLRWLGYGFMGALIALFLLLFAVFVLPAATITITPGQEPIAVSVQMIADSSIDTLDLEENRVPARLIETNIEEVGTIVPTGFQQKAAANARGTVTFSNLGTAGVFIPHGTIVSTSTGTAVRFQTNGNAELGGGIGTKVNVPVEAVDPGVEGNVRANTISSVDGPLRFRTQVTNNGGTWGGGSETVRVVTQQDKDNLLATTKERAESNAYQRLLEELEPGEWLPRGSIQTFVIAQAFDRFNDEVANEVGLRLRVLVQGTAIDDELTTEATLANLRSEAPEQGRLVANSVQFFREPGAFSVGRNVVYTVTAQAQYVIPIDPAEVRSVVAGRTPSNAITELQNRWSLTSAPDIYRDPEILATLPFLHNRIQVRIEYEGGESFAE